jgi:hypothetical protein
MGFATPERWSVSLFADALVVVIAKRFSPRLMWRSAV